MAGTKLELRSRRVVPGYQHVTWNIHSQFPPKDSRHIRDLFHQEYRGSSSSFGYPARPNLEDHKKLFALLHPEENVGVRLTTGFLLAAEQSTSAIVVHHPGAQYFVV